MTEGRDPRERRLAQIDPSPPQARPRVSATEWGAAIHDDIVGGRRATGGRSRARRAGSLILAGAGVAALAALMAVLILASGGPDRPPTATTATYRVMGYPGGPAVSRSTLEATSRLINERAAAIGRNDVEARVTGVGEIALSAPGASAEELDGLTAVGRLSVYPRARAFVGEAAGTVAEAVHAAQIAAGAPSTRSTEDALPPGFAIIRDLVNTPHGTRVRFQALRGTPAVTEADVSAARVREAAGTANVALEFTAGGATAFEQLTRALAQDGALQGRSQSFAIVVDGVLVSSPSLDYKQFPAGIDGRNGLGFEIRAPLDAKAIGARLATGPLPLQLFSVHP